MFHKNKLKNRNKYSLHLIKSLNSELFLFNRNLVIVTEQEAAILIIWSQFFHFKCLWNLQTAHH